MQGSPTFDTLVVQKRGGGEASGCDAKLQYFDQWTVLQYFDQWTVPVF
jgi:hypothetical protein